jgi:hypothetical protein
MLEAGAGPTSFHVDGEAKDKHKSAAKMRLVVVFPFEGSRLEKGFEAASP